ncbi:delta subunit of GMP phosphodiesterase [Gorgonomyces haynaldii]|nr:delta subunit of GMP phosphodiesterase [Gorgonomyces haynaldii]
MRDSRSKELLWESLEWGPGERTAILPKRTLDCPSVTREILFTSEQKIENLSLIQRVIYHGEILEEWRFQFGFVIPRSENTWQNEIERDAQYIPASELSGKTVIETLFMEGGTCIHRSSVRLYYE